MAAVGCATVELNPSQHSIKPREKSGLARVYGEKKRNFVGQHFWAKGYFVSTVGRDEAVIREYIKNQEREDSRLEQMNLWR
jgi:putative transposase